MRLLSYNIHKGIGGSDRRYSLERILRVIEEAHPDLICLQEVDANVSRSNHDDQPRLIAEHFRARASVFQLNVRRKQGGYGNLLLSRWPLLSREQVSLRLNWRKPRGAVLAVIDTPGGPLQLVNWHLGLVEHERRWQVRHLLDHAAFQRSAHLPTVIVGDYNDWRDTLGRRVFHAHNFEQATAPLGKFRSFPAVLSLMSLDKFYHRGNLRVHQAEIMHTPLTRRASDHLPLVVDFHLTS
jgi:endonuclease/exonuclease/phosphatase family metal-dependent hydrolase